MFVSISQVIGCEGHCTLPISPPSDLPRRLSVSVKWLAARGIALFLSHPIWPPTMFVSISQVTGCKEHCPLPISPHLTSHDVCQYQSSDWL